jgi:hypothetical protein
MSKLQKKPSAFKKEHPAVEKIKFVNYFYFSGPFLDPDPYREYGSGSTTSVGDP